MILASFVAFTNKGCLKSSRKAILRTLLYTQLYKMSTISLCGERLLIEIEAAKILRGRDGFPFKLIQLTLYITLGLLGLSVVHGKQEVANRISRMILAIGVQVFRPYGVMYERRQGTD